MKNTLLKIEMEIIKKSENLDNQLIKLAGIS